MVHRFNLNWARSLRGAEHIWVCVAGSSHILEDRTGMRAAGQRRRRSRSSLQSSPEAAPLSGRGVGVRVP